MRQVQDQASKLRHAAATTTNGFRTIAITSGKGGVGKTSLAVNLGLLMAGNGQRVALLDGDMGLANVDVLLGMTPKFTLRHVVEGQKELTEIMLRGPNGLYVIPASRGVEAMAHLPVAGRARLLGRLEQLEGLIDILLIDTAAGISPNVLSLILAADEAIVVTVPEPTAITDAYAIIKVLSRHRADLRAGILMNMVEGVSQAEEVFDQLRRIIRHFLKLEVRFTGHVLRDECVGRAVCEQKPFSVCFPYARASRSLHELAKSLAAPSQFAPHPEPFWGRMIHLAAQL
ncbi:MinD/ParA family protein [Candidatus Methylomirabilis sp.]|uniref:MinD/ParA family protein n=1 Tax=Candidatus Methylomirabilis sp. TaxID=2032687 RepID=UPI002A66BC1D|nr:MinD/ParA family protein [Candidatus Methylomirabilis sp.]